MQTTAILLPLLLFCLIGSTSAFVYSCEEVRYKLINENFAQNTTFACVFTQEGYSKWDNLKRVSLVGYSTSLADIAAPSGCISKKPSEPSWRLIADAGFALDCSQEFTLVMTSDIPSFQTPFKQPRKGRVTNREVFVQPRAYSWYHTESCFGDGNVTFATGAGVGEKEERYDLRIWQCWNIPDWIFSFDPVNTISVDKGITLTTEYSSDPGTSHYPTRVEKGDNIVILTSGRADDIQNLKGRSDNRALIQIGNWDPADVSMNLFINTDRDDSGWVTVQKEWGGASYNYYNGTRNEIFNTVSGYFEVRWEPQGKDASDIWNSMDHIDVDIWIQPKKTKTSPQPATTTTVPRRP